MLTMQVIGNLGADPEAKTTERGVKLCRFSLASNKKIKGEKITTWVNVTVFDEHKIEFITKYLRKGSKVFIEGEPQARAYESQGESRASLDCVLSYGSKIEICSSDAAEGNGNSRASDAASSQDNAASSQGSASDWGNDDDDLDDEVPF